VATLRALLRELLGMFVDDGSLALVLLAVVALAAWVSLGLEDASATSAAVLVIGCVGALAENIVRAARKAELRRRGP
jgi:hypothetical protein